MENEISKEKFKACSLSGQSRRGVGVLVGRGSYKNYQPQPPNSNIRGVVKPSDEAFRRSTLILDYRFVQIKS